MNKRILLFPVAVLMAAGLASCNKGGDTEGHLVTYDVSNGVCVASLSNKDRNSITNITVPNAVDGKPVVEISKGAFKACPNLKSITLPFIGHKTNSDGIGGLFGYVFGDEMYDEGGAFTWQCYGLGNRYDDGVTDYHEFAIPKSLHSVTITGGDYISAGAFSKCKNLRDITITDDNKATEIGNYAFYDCTSLKSFTIPSKIKTIGRKAFQRCYNLQKIEIPEGVTTVRHNAFSKCISASRATIPTTVDEMGKLVFEDFVSGLILTPLKEDNPNWDPNWANSNASIVYDYHNDSMIIVDNVQLAICGEGDSRYFFLVQYLGTWEGKKILVPGEVTVNGLTLPLKKIGSSVFTENTYAEELEIQEGVEVIGAHAFATCTNLIKVTFPDSLKEIGAYAFYDCRKLGTNAPIKLPKVKKLGIGSFMGCFSKDGDVKYGLTRIDLGNELEEIGESAFENDELLIDSKVDKDPEDPESSENYEFVIPKSVKKIGARAFYNTFKYGTEDMGDTAKLTFAHEEGKSCKIEEVGESAFRLMGVSPRTIELYPEYNKKLLIDIDFGEITLLKIPDYMFYLTYIGSVKNFPVETLEEVGDYAFYYSYGRSGQAYIKLGENLKVVGDHSFCYCGSMEFNLLDGNPNKDKINITTVKDYGFYGCSYSKNNSLTIPDTVETMGTAAFSNCAYLKYIKFPDDEVCKITGLSSSVFSSCSRLEGSDSENNSETLMLPSTISTIGSSAFNGCTNLKHIEFKNEEGAAESPIKSIGSSAFYNCSVLEDINFNGTLSKCTSFGSSVYYQCYALKNPPYPTAYTSVTSSSFYNCTGLTSFTIPATVTTINTYAFYNCNNLTTIETSASIATINSFAFANCSSLSQFEMPSSVTTIGDNAFAYCTSLGKENNDKFILPSSLTLSWTGSKGIGSNVFQGWGKDQTIYFTQDNLKQTFDEQNKVETLWGWELTKQTDGTYRSTLKDCGSDLVVFSFYKDEQSSIN